MILGEGNKAGARFPWYAVHSGPGPLEGIDGILVRRKNLFRLVLSGGDAPKVSSVKIGATAVESVAKRDVAHAYKPRVVAHADGPLNTTLGTVAMRKGFAT